MGLSEVELEVAIERLRELVTSTGYSMAGRMMVPGG